MSRPTRDQLDATNPLRSNWVTANAGSGKTHVLTQRVARLLLTEVAPHKILCLTYTKSAAAEMQTRLFRLLGGWAMASEHDLGVELANLTGSETPVIDPETLANARRLFARALETPGGLKIQTIHAFCDSLLRRFPLEAGISPRFDVADGRRAIEMIAGVRADLGDAAEHGTDDALDLVASLLNEGGIDDLSAAILREQTHLRVTDLEDRLTARFGDATRLDEVEIARRALTLLNWNSYRALERALLDHGGRYDRPVGEVLETHRDVAEGQPSLAVQALIGKILKSDFQPRSPRGFPVKAVKTAYPNAEEDLRRLTEWAEETRKAMMASRMAAHTLILYRFAEGLMTRHDAIKAGQGLLDFHDLIARVEEMLTQSAMRAWVLYKLDQGIEHILVDEAQDTSPLQWKVIRAITDDFLSGDGASTAERSLFVVGDEKQSIYSFQGAEPQRFGITRQEFAQRFKDLDDQLWRPQLTTSFRSAPALLEFVDHVFAGEAAEGLTVDNDPVVHQAHRNEARGRVDLWPLIEPPEQQDEPEWWKPVDLVPQTDAKEQLARVLARQIRDMIGLATLPARGERPARYVSAGDILVLVSKRDRLARGLIRELKALGVPVAGADRLQLTSELAVKDLLALARMSVMPEDDFSTAALLRSPLFDLPEADLYDLAQPRTGSLRQALRQSEKHADIAGMLDRMTEQADYQRPYEFFETVLIQHGGRQKLLARLGREAEDAVDEFLTQALAYESAETPTLTGFIAWMDAVEIPVKREMDGGSDEVRVMTVHGAKGLEAPIVILPDTTSGKGGGGARQTLVPAVADGNAPELMLWLAAKDQDDPAAAAAREVEERRARDERRRLLYVALTRAEDWLILCGANSRRPARDTWYEMLVAGMAGCAEVTELPSPTGEGQMLRYQTGIEPEVVVPAARTETTAKGTLPGWLTEAPIEVREERKRPSDLSPSRALIGEDGSDNEALGGIGLGRDLAKRRGVAVHLLLEHVSPETLELDPLLVDRLLESALSREEGDLRAGVVAEVNQVLAMPTARQLFGPEAIAEMAVSIENPMPDRKRMLGRIDRLILTDDTALVVDIKSDGAPPDTAEAIPAKYLAQLGAYLSAVRQTWPDRRAEAAILWTRTANLMNVPTEIADHAYLTANWDARQT